MKNIFFLIIGLLWMNTFILAQSVPTPAPAQSKAIILQNATIHTATGKVIEKGDVLFMDGKIVEVGTVTQSLKTAEIIDLTGKHIYPGIIAPNSQIGLREIEAVRATDDYRETGEINPNIRAIAGYNTDSRVTPTLRSEGVLLAQITPSGGLFSGTSSVVQLDAWNWEDAAYKTDEGIHLNWPRMKFGDAPWLPSVEEQKKRTAENLAKLAEAMTEAKAYAAAKKAGLITQTDLRWESMIPVLDRKMPLYIHANDEKQILASVAFASENNLKMVLVGGADAGRVTEVLKANQIPVILQKPHSLPGSEDDPVDMMYRLPKTLQDAGINFCLSYPEFWNNRNLPFLAGTAVAYGLTPEQGLASITLNTAEILGIADRTGSIEPGKDATLIVSTGDLLDMRTSIIEHAWIQGRKIDLGNKQKDLYQKYKDRK